MTNKFFRIFTIVLIVTGIFTGVAYAAESDTGQPDRPFPQARRFGVRGEIIAVNPAAGTFILESPRGELPFLTNERTRFRGAIGSLEEVEVGMPAAVMALRQEPGDLLALQVVVHKELDRVKRYGGEVTTIDPSGAALTLATQNQDELIFLVDEKTRYRGALEGFADLEAGQIIFILGATLDDGSLKALLIFAPERPLVRRFGGEVTAVDLEQASFTVLTQRGESMSILTDRETVFHSRNDEIDSLEDIEVGMPIVVIAQLQREGVLLGKHVIVQLSTETR